MTEEKESTEKAGLKPAQIAASALAAVTAAFLGSTLGVAGTVVGAGIASVVTTVGGEVYLRSLRKTRQAARKTKEVLALTDTRLRQETQLVEPPRRSVNPLMQPSAQRGVPRQTRQDAMPLARHGQLPPAQTNAVQPTKWIPKAGDGQSESGQRTVFIARQGAQPPLNGRTQVFGQPVNGATQVNGAVNGATQVNGQPPLNGQTQVLTGPEDDAAPKKPWWKNRWTLLIGTSVVAFLVGMLVITGFEGITGQAISGGSGTTFSRVVGGSGGSSSTTTTVTPTETQQSETSTNTTGSQTPTSQTQSQAPAPQSETVQPTQSSSAQESATPTQTESAAPSSGP